MKTSLSKSMALGTDREVKKMGGEANKSLKKLVCAGIVTLVVLAGVREAKGYTVTQLTYEPSYEGEPAWSPDGSKIAFVSDRDGNCEIYVMDANGSNQERLTHDERRDNYPAWSPDGKKLAYVSGGGKEISIIDLETGIQTVIFSPNHWLATPAWSPNGEKIAFCYNEFGGGIFTINSDGSNQTYLADGWEPDWSPDGEKIIYVGQGVDIYIMNADGSEQINLTNHPGYDYEASWSPDGMKIAFTSERGMPGEIYLMNNDGTEQIRLTYNDWPDRNSSARDASWSPDGNYIAFARGREMHIPEEDVTPWLPEIYIINICNKNLTRLTNNDFVNKQPAWCPMENVDKNSSFVFRRMGK